MTDIALPSGLTPSRATWRLERNRAIEESPFSRVAQTQGRPGDRWACTLGWPTYQGDKAYALATWLDQVSKPGNCALLPAHQNELRGLFTKNSAPLLSEGWATAGELAKWAEGANIDAYTDSAGLLILQNTSNPPGPLTRTFTVQANLYHALVIDSPSIGGDFRITASDGVTTLLDQNISVAGRYSFTLLPTTTALTISLFASTTAVPFTQRRIGDLQLYRVLRNGSARAAGGSFANLKGSTTSFINTFLAAGQFIVLETSAGYELKRVSSDVRGIGAITENGVSINHQAFTYFEPPSRGAIALNSTVYHHNPWCRMRLATAVSSADVSPPLLHGFSVDFVEEL